MCNVVFKKLLLVGIILMLTTVNSYIFSNPILDRNGPGGRSITAFDRIGQRSIGGYFDTEYVNVLDSDYTSSKSDSSSTFKAHRFILEVSSQVHEDILINSEIEFEYGGYVTNSASGVQKGEIKIEQAWLDYRVSELFVNRVGIILVPFGRVNVLHDSDVREATQRPIYSSYIVPSTWMDTGVGFYGQKDIQDLELGYELYVFNGLADTSGSTADDISLSEGIRKSRPNYKQDNNGSKAIAARVEVSPSLGLNLGMSLYSGNYDDAGKNNLLLTGIDLFYKNGRYETLLEFAKAFIDNDGYSSIPAQMEGGYLEFRSHVLQGYLRKKLPSLSKPVITLFSRLGYVNTDTVLNNTTVRYTLGFNFRPTESVVYKFEISQDDYRQVSETGYKTQFISSVAVGF